jgi:ubiquinone/menaquinone biosynthesis C-methylase UbiE
MRVTKLALLLFVAFLGVLSEPAAAAARPTSEPYKGDLAIFEDPSRAQKLQVERVMDLLGIKRGSHVADIGAGSGWFTVRSARRVGSGGVVYAVEINPGYIRHIERRAKREKLSNIRTVLGKPHDPMLPRAGIDAALLLKTYHEIAQPIAFLRRLRPALRSGARLGVIDRSGKGDDHGVNAEVVIKEAAQAGFRLVAHHDFVKGDSVDYFLIFQAQGAE